MMIASNQEVTTGTPSVATPRPEPPAQQYLTKDQIFHLLQNERRRLALRYLQGRDGEVEMRDVAEQVAAWQHNTTVEALDSDQRQRVYIPLYQNHLPKLDEKGVIEYNQSRGVVERTPIAEQLDPYLADDESTTDSAAASGEPTTETDPWPRCYLATSAVSTGLLGGAALGAPILGSASAVTLGLFVVLAFSTLSVAQFLDRSFSSPVGE